MDSQDYFRASKARTERGYTTFDIALDTAINDQVINLPGTLFFLDKSSTGICTVEGNVGQGTSRNPLLASPGFSMFNDEGFADFRISAPAQAGKVLKIVVATGMSIKPGDAVTSGAVSTQTVDAGLVRTLNQQAYLGAGWATAVPGDIGHVQLWNPATSTKSVIVEAVSASTPAASTLLVQQDAAQLANPSNLGVNKRFGGAASNALIRYQTAVGLIGSDLMLSYNMAAGAVQTINFREPIVLLPGRGLNLICQFPNITLNANFEWFEQ